MSVSPDNIGQPVPPVRAFPVTGVDCHAHVMRLDAPLAPGRHSAPARDVAVDEFIALLDAHGLSHGVLTQPSFYGSDNSILLSALAQYPARLRGTAIVEEDITEAALHKLRAAHIRGVRLNWTHRPHLPDISSRGFQLFLGRIAAAGLHIEVYLEGPRLAAVLPYLRASGALVVVDHFGAPDPVQRLACAGFRAVLDGVATGQVAVKLSAPYRLGGADPKPYVDALLEAGGAQQLVWASDWPWVSYEAGQHYGACLAALESWVSNPALRHTILAESPLKLMGFTD